MSNLKYFSTPSSQPEQSNRITTSPVPQKKQKMSLSQTYMLAHSARGKLSKEASRADHNLRRLVGHANMLDNLMLDLANAEDEQERWFNQSLSSAKKASSEPKHVQWAAAIPEEALEDEEDSDSESDDEEFQVAEQVPFRRVAKTPPPPPATEDEDSEMEDDDDYEDDLALTRTASHPPELMHEDSDSESEDESMPPSPPSTTMTFDAFSEKQRQAIATTSFYQSNKSLPEQDTLFHNGITTTIAAY